MNNDSPCMSQMSCCWCCYNRVYTHSVRCVRFCRCLIHDDRIVVDVDLRSTLISVAYKLHTIHCTFSFYFFWYTQPHTHTHSLSLKIYMLSWALLCQVFPLHYYYFYFFFSWIVFVRNVWVWGTCFKSLYKFFFSVHHIIFISTIFCIPTWLFAWKYAIRARVYLIWTCEIWLCIQHCCHSIT